MNRSGYKVWGMAGLLWLALTASALAQSKQLSIELSRLTTPIRYDAPMNFVWKVTSNSSSMIEGRLQVVIVDGGQVIARSISEEVFVSAGDQFVKTQLPAIDSYGLHSPPDLIVEFISNGKSLGKWNPPMPQPPLFYDRKLVALISDPWSGSLPEGLNQLVEGLRIEMWNSKRDEQAVSTLPTRVRPESFAADALAYCGFDMALLAEEGFSELKEVQLKAIADWVSAGGSLFVAPVGARLKDYHVNFLNQTTHAVPGENSFALDPSGKLTGVNGGTEAAATYLRKDFGLGRVVVLRGRIGDKLDLKEVETRTTLAYLWRLRHDKMEEFLNEGTFTVETAIFTDQPNPNENQYVYPPVNSGETNRVRPSKKQLAPLPLRSGDQLVSRLMPEGLKVVPLPLIGMILVAYVVLIGPVDWTVLGLIRRRKWTWFTFPFVTVALTFLTIWLAEWYMQISGSHRLVTIHDIGADGRVARRNQFEILFKGAEGEVKTELNREILTPMALQRFSNANWMANQNRQMQGGSERNPSSGIPLYVGRMPSQYTVTQTTLQWTPQLNRRFSIPRADDDPAPFDWEKYADRSVYRPDTIKEGDLRTALLNDVVKAFGSGAQVAVFCEGKRINLQGNFSFLSNEQIFGMDEFGNPIANNRYQPYYNGQQQSVSFIDDVTVNSMGGFFNVVSQLSPTGGRDFEDLVLVDPSDPDQWLLLIAVDRGAEVDMYRKLYRKGE